MKTFIFLKLGGSLITDKDRENTIRKEVIQRLAAEIAEARAANPDLGMLIGHGSGSFGHNAAHQHSTRAGVGSPRAWQGFAEVWFRARLLNQIVIESLREVGLPVIAFPPSAFFLACDGKALPPPISPLQAALEAGLIPVVNGDTVFDTARGGTILSTEDIFSALVPSLSPARILLAGIEHGVYADYPTCLHLIPYVTPFSSNIIRSQIQGSASIDVTGGMRSKVDEMLSLAQQYPGFEALIFSGMVPGNLREALKGFCPGTRIHA